MRTTTRLAIATCAIALGAGPATAAAPRVVNCTEAVTKPKRLVLACADGGIRLTGIRWTGWGSAEVRGTATRVQNDCDPSCAGGTFRRQKVRLTASRLRKCGDQGRFYTRLTVRRTGEPAQRWRLLCGVPKQ